MSLRTILNFARQTPGFLFSRSTSVADCNLETSESVNATMPDEDVGKDGETGGGTADDISGQPEVKQADGSAPTCSELELGKEEFVKVEPSNAEAVVDVSSESASVVKEASENPGDDCVCLGVREPSPKQVHSQGSVIDTSEEDLKDVIPAADDNLGVSEGNKLVDAPCLRTEDISSTETPMEIAATPNADQVPEQDSRAKDDVRDEQLCEGASIIQPSHCGVDEEMSDVPQDRVQSPVPASGSDLNDKGKADGMMLEDSGPSCAAKGKALQDSPSEVGVTDLAVHSETPQLVEVGLQTAEESLTKESHVNVSCKNVPCLPRKEEKAGNGCSLDGPSLAGDNSDSEPSFEAFRRTVRRKKRVVKIIDSDDEAVSESEASSEKSRSFFDDEAEESPPHFGDDDVFPSDCDKRENSDKDESFEVVEDFFDAEAEESLGDDDECSKSDSGGDMLSQDEDDCVNSEGDRYSQEERYLRHSSRERSSSSDPTSMPEGGDYSSEGQLFGGKVERADQKKEAEIHSNRDADAEKCGKDRGDALQEEIEAGTRHVNIFAWTEEKSSKDVEDHVGTSHFKFESGRGMEAGNGAIVMVLPSQAEEKEDEVDVEAGKLKVESAKGMTPSASEAIDQHERRSRLIDRLLTSGAITEDEATLLRSGSSEVENKQSDLVVEVPEHIQQCELLIEEAGILDASQQKMQVTADHVRLEECRKESKKRKKKLNEEGDLKIDGADETENQHRKNGNRDGPMEVCIPEAHRTKEKPKRKGKGTSPVNLVESKHEHALRATTEVPTDSVTTGVLCQGLVDDGSTRVQSTVTRSVVEASEEHGTAGDVDAAGDKRRAKKRRRRLLTDLEVGAVKDSGPPSVESQEECLEKSVQGFTAQLNDNSLECQESLPLAEIGRERPRRKKKSNEAAATEIHPTKERQKGTKETKDKDDAAPDKQSTEVELVSPKEMVDVLKMRGTQDLVRQDAPRMEVPTKKRKKRQGGSTGHRNLSTVEEETPETATEKREKRKKKRKTAHECASDFTSADRTDAVSSPQVGSLLTTSKSAVEQVSASEGVQGLTSEVAEEGRPEFPNEKTNRKKKKRQSQDTKVDTENLMLEGADVGPEFLNEKSGRNKNRANDASVIDGDKGSLKRKRRKGEQQKLDDSSLKESDELEEPTEQGIASVIAFPVRKAKKLGSRKRREQQSEGVELQESRKSDSAGCTELQKDLTREEGIPVKQGIKHRKKESREVAGRDLDVVKCSENDKTSEQEGIKSLWDRYVVGSPAKPARNSPSVRKKKRKHKSDRIQQEVMPTGAEADIENNETTLDNILKKYIAQTPEKLRRSPFKQRGVVSGKKAKVARKLIPTEGHGAPNSPKRKKKKKVRKL